MTNIETTDALDLTSGIPVRGMTLTTTAFIAVANFNQLRSITRHPIDLQPNARRSGYDADALAEEAEVHELIQRALTGAKKSNVPKYATYIEEVVDEKRPGVLPPIHLWSAEPLRTFTNNGENLVLVPHGTHLLAIDGETQLTAHYETWRKASPELRKKHGAFPLALVIHHGIDVRDAQLYFHDLNVLAVRPNVSLGLSMDSADPLMQVVNNLERTVPVLAGRVEHQRRQLPKNSPKTITTQALRQMVINVAKGVSGVQYGARPAPLDDVDMTDLEQVAKDWIGGFFDSFGAAIADRENCLAGSPAVLAAVGALGQTIMRADPGDREAVRARLLDTLRSVDWTKGDHWIGIAGTIKAKGFSVSGPKEAAYNIYAALTNADSDSYRRIRHYAGTGGTPSSFADGQGELAPIDPAAPIPAPGQPVASAGGQAFPTP